MLEKQANVGAPKTPEQEKQYKYDVVVTLGGGIREHDDKQRNSKENKRWRTTNYSESDDYGALGSRARIITTEYLHKKGNIAANFLTTTGKPNYLTDKKGAPTESEVAKTELIRRGLPAENIFLEDKSKNTAQNIEYVLQIVKEHHWKKLLIVSNNYHIPRIQVLYEKYVKEHKGFEDLEITYQGAEDVLKSVNPKWEKYIDQAYNLENMKTRIANEEKGQSDLAAARYKSIQKKPNDQ